MGTAAAMNCLHTVFSDSRWGDLVQLEGLGSSLGQVWMSG